MAAISRKISSDKSLCGSVSSLSSGHLTSSSDMSKEDLVRKLKEYRQANIELLEDKRHLLLRSQEASKVEAELEQRKKDMLEMQSRVEALESNLQNNAEKFANNTIEALVRQLSNTSKKSNENQVVKDSPTEEKEDVFQEIKSHLTSSNTMAEQKMQCHCGAAASLAEVIKVNHFWQKDYNKLSENFNKIKARLWKAESQMRSLQFENEDLMKTVQKVGVEKRDVNKTSEMNLYTLDDIEALKQQLIIYKEDYSAEKEDSKKLTEEQNRLKLELQKAYGIIDSLTVKNETIKENYRRVSSEKEHIMKELRRLSTSTLPFSPVSPLNRRMSNQESFETIRSEDIIAHSPLRAYSPPRLNSPHPPISPPRTYSPPNIHIPSSFYGRGRMVRDGVFPLNNFHKDNVDLDENNRKDMTL